MLLQRLRIQNFRNHENTEIHCPSGILYLWGENGAGKTSVLEAVSLLCLTKSFVTTQDRNLVQTGRESFRVSGWFHDNAVPRTVEVAYPVSRLRKSIVLDHQPLPTAAELVGRFPVVILHPQHRLIAHGGPGERRKFMDVILSQAHPGYLLDLLEYRKVVRHRNAILSREELPDSRRRTLLEPWNDSFVRLAAKVTRRRRNFVKRFAPQCVDTYQAISGGREQIGLRYVSSVAAEEEEESAVDLLLGRIRASASEELRRGKTLLGPHRDDLEILLNGLDLRLQASQGQIKTTIIALKMAEFFYLEEVLRDTPILLLDDVFSELDRERLGGIIQLVRHVGQALITSVEENAARHLPVESEHYTLFKVENGRILDDT